MQCCTCDKDKAEEEFAFRNKNAGKRNAKCKECQNEYSRNHYRLNKRTYIKRANRRTKQNADRLRKLMLKFLQDKFCIDCGMKDIRVLEFDHIVPNLKKNEVTVEQRGTYRSVSHLLAG